MSECIHGFDAGLCDVCFPKSPPERPRSSRATRSTPAPGTRRNAPASSARPSISPANQRVYHVTHIGNLEAIVSSGGLIAGTTPPVDLSSELTRELRASAEIEPGDPVNGYVPFYLDPASDGWLRLRDGGGADPRWSAVARAAASTDFVFLVSTVAALGQDAVIADGDAAASLTSFARGSELGRMLVRLHDSGTSKGAEALAKELLPWEAVQLIGVANERIRDRVRELTDTKVAVYPPWFSA